MLLMYIYIIFITLLELLITMTSAESATAIGEHSVSLQTTARTSLVCTLNCTHPRMRLCHTLSKCQGRQQELRSCWKKYRRCNVPKLKRLESKKTIGNAKRQLDEVVYNLVYGDWSEWSACTRFCKKRRYRPCVFRRWCKDTVLLEERRCFHRDTNCEEKYSSPERREYEDGYDDDNDHSHGFFLNETELPKNCGLRVNTPSPRIVGGYETRKASWPWQVAITTKWHEVFCGGVLIAPRWVLTAAHCVRKNGRRRRVIVRLGEHNLSEYEGSEINIKVARDFVHNDFDIQSIESDIALLKLRQSIDTNAYIHYACVPDADAILPTHTVCYALGWGKMKAANMYGTNVLQEAPMPLVDAGECQSVFAYIIEPTQVCAGYKRGGVDTCAGDSGGPLMCLIKKDGNERWHVYGITSFGEGCGERGKYGIYTRVSQYSNWIKLIMMHN